jgi:hypothetical protein
MVCGGLCLVVVRPHPGAAAVHGVTLVHTSATLFGNRWYRASCPATAKHFSSRDELDALCMSKRYKGSCSWYHSSSKFLSASG